MGRALLAHLAKLAKERNCGRLEWSVLDWNELAIRLYKGVGAVPMDEWTVYRVAREALDKLAARQTVVRPCTKGRRLATLGEAKGQRREHD